MDIKFKESSEQNILNLKIGDTQWVERAFYYPSDKDNIFYQVINGRMRKFDCTLGSGTSTSETAQEAIGILLNSKMYSGYKMNIIESDILFIPEDYEYHGNYLTINGLVNCEGIISI